MFLFSLKKFVSDAWENFIPLMVINLLSLLPFLLAFSLSSVESFPAAAILPVRLTGTLLTLLFLSAAGVYVKVLSEYGKVKKGYFWSSLAKNGKDVLGGYALGGFFAAAIFVAVPFYLEKMGTFGVAAASVVLAIAILGALGLPYYFAVRNQEGLPIFKSWAKAYQFVFKNMGMVTVSVLLPLLLVLVLVSLIQMVVLQNPSGLNYFSNMGLAVVLGLSVFALMFLPGPAGFLLWFQNVYRLGTLKDTWVMDHKGQRLNWKEILAPEQELLDQRKEKSTLKSRRA